MTAINKTFLPAILLFLLSCHTKQDNLAGKALPLIPKDTTIKNERENKLFVFVGEKVDVTPLPHSRGDFDSGVKAKYKILERVYGYYDNDIIEFEAYDHFGRFSFADYKYVLMYVSEDSGKYYHQKYMYDPVYKTKDGRWAGPCSAEYGREDLKHVNIKPEIIDFAEEVSYPLKVKGQDGKEYTVPYQEPCFKITGDKAIVVYGNYVPELFRLKKEGVLTARQLFGDKKPEIQEMTIQDLRDTAE